MIGFVKMKKSNTLGQEIRKMKKLSSLTAAVLVGATMLSVAGCSGIRYIESEDIFFDALKNTVGIKKRDLHTT